MSKRSYKNYGQLYRENIRLKNQIRKLQQEYNRLRDYANHFGLNYR